ncbi:aldehyde dehydrogenase family protein [Streptomyces uncialis]|uniref:Aldehyde dehydrogenase n=1 Tax=Streptomyces uncialis TaxID=1048205 RepID=A0A1Q4V5P8_9ACTN|nr:aldehyde dehydrogenase family protein [Streptomyces uncialis]OKH93137.1 aldehyde dehydrogenase [Streptomyces uncialis]
MTPDTTGTTGEYTSHTAGRRRAPAGTAVPLTDPATGAVWAHAYQDPDAVDEAVAAARAAFTGPDWAGLPAHARADLLYRLGDVLVAHTDELAALETLANGKPLAATRGEVGALARWYRYFAAVAETLEDRSRPLGATAHARITQEPLGVVAALTPFNGALSLGSWKLAPALAAGNTVILKPPPQAPASSVRLAELALEAGFPPGVVSVVIGGADEGRRLTDHPDVAMITFTGSTAVARTLGARAAERMKRYVCEAGGKSAHIVFADGDLDAAVTAARQGAFSAAGQTCVAGSRVLVQREVHEEFLRRYGDAVGRLRVGDPRDPRTHVGPLASAAALTRVERYVDEALAGGARAVTGGKRATVPESLDGGYWYEPTVLTDAGPDLAVCREEVFGPVVTVHPFDTEDDAVALANSVEYGLAAGFWTRDAARAHRVARRLEAGVVWVNTYRLLHWSVPFGGYKQSGLGRENGAEAVAEFLQTKSVITEHGTPADPFAH